ncbi:hypothetical protein GE21DRAFT_2795 [Neurospora crassa]|uniref:Uncharacterized protein n=2 Tax=Neurospora crassa TaxID=5141 RepID=Q7RX66_NEUCR|nr:hypothetical protein NCU03467 [Neurospora crassa OR74A]EAA27120.3 hypothetical protein NCU03467 [Neurospora crassa OR74A]KHE86332.1 hypothetical protein GE21DRAFT_2795 [Neurospora crassa]|eukprot:XP_956356.3 hypothetical protein NCU03467 [Neurospora crassa OR74A]
MKFSWQNILSTQLGSVRKRGYTNRDASMLHIIDGHQKVKGNFRGTIADDVETHSRMLHLEGDCAGRLMSWSNVQCFKVRPSDPAARQQQRAKKDGSERRWRQRRDRIGSDRIGVGGL